jgi:glycosyltransferase involved in cell wall biosynthesis
MRRCAPHAVLLILTYWIYDHPMITFVPTLAKKLLPRAPFVTLFEEARDFNHSRSTWLARLGRKVMKQLVGPKGVDYSFGTVLRDSDRFIMVSDVIRAVVAKSSPDLDGRTVVIPPPPLLRVCPDGDGAVRRRKRESLGVAPDDVLLIFFGYVRGGKGLETLLEAFSRARRGKSNLRLMITGGSRAAPGHSFVEELRDSARRLGVDDKLIWTGGYDWGSDEPSHCLRAADVCVLPFDDGVSVHNTSFAAAAAHGLPTITTRGAVLETPFVHGKNVYLCRPRDSEALAATIELFVEQPALRDDLRAGVRELADEWFSWKRATERTVTTLSKAGDAILDLDPIP